MQIEMNGRGGWYHDITIDHCTFEPCGGEILSFDITPRAASGSTVGATVGGAVRVVEGLHITNNDFQGTGVSMYGFTPQYGMGFEFGNVHPLPRIPRSAGRTSPATGSAAVLGVGPVEPQRCQLHDLRGQRLRLGLQPRRRLRRTATLPGAAPTSTTPSSRTTLTSSLGVTTCSGDPAIRDRSGNTFSSEDWTKGAGRMGGLHDFPFANSTYADCHFHLRGPRVRDSRRAPRARAASSKVATPAGSSTETARRHLEQRDGTPGAGRVADQLAG